MIARRLIEDARAAGLSIEVDGADLIVEADCDPPPELLAELRQHKAELIALLSRDNCRPQEVEAIDILAEALVLHDGRCLHRFHACKVPAAVPPHVTALIDEARFRHIVLVADGHDLIVVEPWRSTLGYQTIVDLK